jgi:hypothetical protein
MARTRANEDIELSEAVEATEKELFAAAIGGDPAVHDDTGDQSIEHPDRGLEGDPEDLREDGDETEIEAAPEGDVPAKGDEANEAADDKERQKEGRKKDPKTGQFVKAAEDDAAAGDGVPQKGSVPPARLREATARAKAAEERAKAAETEREAARAEREQERQERIAIKAQMDLLVHQQALREQPQRRQETQPDVEPDMFAEPDAWRAWNRRQTVAMVNEVRQQEAHARVNMNLELTRDTHGDKFDAAYHAIIQASQQEPEARIAINKALASPNPGREIMRWHRERETLREVGSDPTAFRQKIAEETRAKLLADPDFRKEILARLREEGKGASHVIRAPIPARTTIPSLNGANGSATLNDLTQAALDDPSDEGAFNRALS